MWKFFLILREIVSICFRKAIHKDSTEYLKDLIHQHNVAYIKLSKSHLKPKLHILTHYPSIIQKIGPLSLTSSMRFEAKHQTFKKSGFTSNNRKNILKSFNIKHQFQTANYILNYEELSNSFKLGGTLKKATLIQLKKYNLGIHCQIESVISVKMNGIVIRNAIVLCLGNDERDEPKFGLVHDIFKIINKFYVGYQILDTLFFDNHFFCI